MNEKSMNHWQPIDTAPKDIALLVYHDGYTIAHFNTALDRWIGFGVDTSDTRALAHWRFSAARAGGKR